MPFQDIIDCESTHYMNYKLCIVSVVHIGIKYISINYTMSIYGENSSLCCGVVITLLALWYEVWKCDFDLQLQSVHDLATVACGSCMTHTWQQALNAHELHKTSAACMTICNCC